MKKLYTILAALLLTASVAAQNPTAYFMEGTTFRSQFNPAFAPLRGYFNIPGLGGMNLAMTGNLSVDKILYPHNGGLVTLLDGAISSSQALGNLKANNLLGIDTRVNLIGFGAFTKNHKNFWSFDINIRVNADVNLPYELFDFLKTGHTSPINNLGMATDTYMEAGFNYSFPLLGDKLYIGTRVKFLAGAARARLNYDRFDVQLKEDMWNVEAAGQLDVSGSFIETDIHTSKQGNRSYTFADMGFDFTNFKPAGYGFAIDLGATYDILPNLQASLAVTDLGFINWDKKYTLSGRSAKEISFKGISIPSSTPLPNFDFNVIEFTPEAAKGITRMINATINAGVEYQVWNHKIGVGLLYTARFRELKTLHNITGSVNFHPVRWFTLTGSYSVIANRGGAVGLALNLNPNWINFYIATDIVTGQHGSYFIPIKQSLMHVTLGLGIPIGKRSHRIAAYIYNKDK